MIVKMVHAIVALAAVAAAIFTGGQVYHLATRQSVTTTHSMQVGDLTRLYEEITPVAQLPKSAPIIVVLAGISAPIPNEVARDYLVPYANADKAELVYPAGYRESWNAGGCCGYAYYDNVDDVAFLTALAAKIDPGHARPLYLVGYSNGGRMAYRMACSAPGVYDAYAVVKADPQPGCVVSKPTTILQVASKDDNAVPYEPGDDAKETPAATVQIARLRSAGACATAPVDTDQSGWLTYTEWGCSDDTRVGFAVYAAGVHAFPPPEPYEPAAAAVIWSFFENAKTISALPT
jgi:polyhydroxybutyrate depolymerase